MRGATLINAVTGRQRPYRSNHPREIPAAGGEAVRGANWHLDEDEPYFKRLFLTRLDQSEPLAVRPQIRELAAAVAPHPFVQ